MHYFLLENSSVGERPAPRDWTTRPDEQKKLLLGNVFLSLATLHEDMVLLTRP